MNILYYISTGLISVFLFFSTYTYLFSSSTIAGIKELGFPDFFRIELAFLKLIAGFILLLPNSYTSPNLKEWAYAGIGLFFITAIIAHAAHKDPISINTINFVLLALLITSYVLNDVIVFN